MLSSCGVKDVRLLNIMGNIYGVCSTLYRALTSRRDAGIRSDDLGGRPLWLPPRSGTQGIIVLPDTACSSVAAGALASAAVLASTNHMLRIAATMGFASASSHRQFSFVLASCFLWSRPSPRPCAD